MLAARALDFTCQICNALDHAHQQGVIHRDVKPGNVIVKVDPRYFRPTEVETLLGDAAKARSERCRRRPVE